MLKARACLRKQVARQTPIEGERQILVDVSVLHQHDAGSGIQRMVRAITQRLQSHPPPGCKVRTVAASKKRGYRYVNLFSGSACAGEKIEVGSRDVFLGLDLSAHILPAHHAQVERWKREGLTCLFTIYDVLPLQHPEWFSGRMVRVFRRWMRSVAILGDGVICISNGVRADFQSWLLEHYGLEPDDFRARVIPLGGDIESSVPSKGLPSGFDRFVAGLGGRKSVLMVGTIEPRKGHAEILDAFEQLWREGDTACLIIVGRPGWKTEHLQARLREHAEVGARLAWFDDASDEALSALYTACDGVIVASQAEGFGLPIIEALGYDKPVLARDIPIFREQQRDGVDYFRGGGPVRLAVEIRGWLSRLTNQGCRPDNRRLPATWVDSVDALVMTIEELTHPNVQPELDCLGFAGDDHFVTQTTT